MNVADIRPVDLFDDCTDAQLEPWAAATQELRFAAGERVIDVGQSGRGLMLLLEGRLATWIPDGETLQPGEDNVAPTWIGAIATLTDGAIGVRMEAREPVRIGVVPHADFERLVLATPEVFRCIMRQMRPVMSRVASWETNRDRLASLGTMAAGLAHELNNPAAAAMRSSQELGDVLQVLATTMKAFIHAGVERAQAEVIVHHMYDAFKAALASGPLDGLAAADAEDELLDALEDLGVADAYRFTESLAAAAVDRPWLDELARLSGAAFAPALAWIDAATKAAQLTTELAESTERMSSLVGAIKSYAYMDRGDRVQVDVREGLETTLKVLKHKVKHTAIEVVRDYADDLPQITVNGPALNQVWTNLIDNAIDALGERGTLTVRTLLDRGCVRVDIADDGPGIPPEVVDRVFDPFFTTKEVGRGTGLGLETARRIVGQHKGSLTVESRPGQTVFHVWIPL